MWRAVSAAGLHSKGSKQLFFFADTGYCGFGGGNFGTQKSDLGLVSAIAHRYHGSMGPRGHLFRIWGGGIGGVIRDPLEFSKLGDGGRL